MPGVGSTDSFEAVLLTAYVGDLNVFILIRGDAVQVDALVQSDEWQCTTIPKANAPLLGR